MRDKDVRNAVLKHLSEIHADDPYTRIVQEMGVWAESVRIDIAVINGELCGYELKSDSDNLNRLPNQADLYSRVFDHVTLVVGKRHLDKAIDLIPSWWGVIQASDTCGDVLLSTIRIGSRNPDPDAYLVAELLRKTEAIEILDRYGLVKGYRGKRVNEVHQKLADELPFRVLADEVRLTLKNRIDWLR